MIISPEFTHDGFVIGNAHPLGCFYHVDRQIDWIQSQPRYPGPRRALVLGISSGYGLASALSLMFGAGTDVVGVAMEKGPVAEEHLTGGAGWWNCVRLQQRAACTGRGLSLHMGDVFADQTRQQVIDTLKQDGKPIDALIYSIASGRRTEPATGRTWYSTLKGTKKIEGLTINMETGELIEQTLEPATEEELEATVKVMGGEDWALWVDALRGAELLAPGFTTTAYTYVGPPRMHDIYTHGALGRAKRHLEQTAERMHTDLAPLGGEAITASMKAIVSKASVFIPTFPVYGSALFKIMKTRGSYETPVQHTHRMLSSMLFGSARELDDQRRLRPDSWEVADEVQTSVDALLPTITQENLTATTDFDGFRQEFLQLNGFAVPGVDYGVRTDLRALASLYP